MAVNVCGFSVMTTTAFWTVLRVTSAGLLSSSLESSCRVQLMPKSERSGVLLSTRVKYEKSSVALRYHWLADSCVKTVACKRGVELRMGTVRQGEEGQQLPVIVNGGIVSLIYPYPSLDFRTTRLTVSCCLLRSRAAGKLYRWWWKSTTATTGRYVSAMVLCYRQRVILRPSSHCYANQCLSVMCRSRSTLTGHISV